MTNKTEADLFENNFPNASKEDKKAVAEFYNPPEAEKKSTPPVTPAKA